MVELFMVTQTYCINGGALNNSTLVKAILKATVKRDFKE